MNGALLLVALSLLLLSARALALIATRLGQPAVVGEIAAGVVLGPTLLGRLFPGAHTALFPATGPNATMLEGLNLVGIVLFLFVAGAEIDIAGVGRRARQALAVALGGMALPLSLGIAGAWLAPAAFGWEGRADRWVFALFVGTALCISALPVIAKTLMDLGLYRTDLGMTVVASAVINDIVGWVLFAFILSTIPGAASNSGMGDGLLVVVLMCGLWIGGRPLIFRLLALVHTKQKGPAGALAVMMPLVFGGAALTEHFGVHAMFGAFVVGATAAGSPHFREHTRSAMNDFVSVLFAPLFFASIGLHVDFVQSFDLPVVALVISVATAGKVLGCFAGARAVGVGTRESWAIGAAMNARGAMEIVLAAVAIRVGLISSRTFVALVVMALATSMLSAPAIRRLFPRRAPRRLLEVVPAEAFVAKLTSSDPAGAIHELAAVLARPAGVNAAQIAELAIAREQLVTTALGDGVAVPHARIEGLKRSMAALGLSHDGVAFDAPDGRPVHAVVLVLTPVDDEGEQVEILADIARTFSNPERHRGVMSAKSFDDVRSAFTTTVDPADR